MDFKQIQELIKLVNGVILVNCVLSKMILKLLSNRKKNRYRQCSSATVQAPAPVTGSSAATCPPTPTADQLHCCRKPMRQAATKADNFITIKSPMIGTFYRRPSPDKPIFAEVGDEVTPGKVVCIIEAMKLFNEIESEVSGKIVKILVEDASPVEYDQPLFLVEPS